MLTSIQSQAGINGFTERYKKIKKATPDEQAM